MTDVAIKAIDMAERAFQRVERLRKALQEIIDDDDSDPVSTTRARDALRLDDAVRTEAIKRNVT